MAVEFVARLEALGFPASERPALRANDVEWLFAPAHPCSNLLRSVSHVLPSLASVTSEQRVAYRSLAAQGLAVQVQRLFCNQ